MQLVSILKRPERGVFVFSSMKYLTAILLFLAWLMPLHFLPWMSWHTEVIVFFAVFLCAWTSLFQLLSDKRPRQLRLPYLVLPFLMLALTAVVQAMTGVMTFGGDAFVWVCYSVMCILCLAFGFASNKQTQTPETALSTGGASDSVLTLFTFTLILGSFASAIVALVQVLELWQHSAWINLMPQLRRPGGNLAQPNHLATLVLMGIASLAFVYESGKLKKPSSILILLTLCIGLAVTESRTGVLSMLVLSCWWGIKKNKIAGRVSSRLVLLTVVGFLIFFLTWPSILTFIQQQSADGSAEVNTKAGVRLVVWPQLLEAVTHRPLWGWGLGEVAKAHNSVAHDYLVSEPFSYAHNILIDLALGIGIPLTSVVVVLAAVWFWRRIRHVAHVQTWYCVAVVLPLAIHSLLEFPFAYAHLIAPALFAVGVLEGRLKPESGFAINVRLTAVLMFVTGLLASWSVVEYLEIEEDFRVARFEALNIGQKPANHEAPNVILLTQLKALLTATRTGPKPGMSSAELDIVKKTALRYPWSATQNRYALSLALNGNHDEAIRQLKVIRALHGERVYVSIKNYWMELGDTKFPQLKLIPMP